MTWLRTLLPRARGEELAWLLVLQAGAALFILYPLSDPWDSYWLAEDLIDWLIYGLFELPLRDYASTGTAVDYDTLLYRIHDEIYDPAKPAASWALVLPLYVFFYTEVALLALPLPWAWMPDRLRAFGWDVLALAGLIFLYAMYRESFYAEEIVLSEMQDLPLPWLEDATQPAITSLAVGYLVCGLMYGHLGRILFARNRRAPAPQTG